MPITFLNPGLLLGALAAAVPILIHFLSRRRILRLEFSDLRFLEEAQTEQSRSLGLRRLLLLLLRVLAVLLVVLAIARPQLGGLAPGGGSGRSLLVVLDASASMQTQQQDGTRFAAARSACAEMIAALPRRSEVQVLLAAATVEPLFDTWVPAGPPAAEAVAAVRPTDGPCDLAAALRIAAEQVTRSRSGGVEIVLLSDLQRARGGISELKEAVRRLTEAGEVRLLIRRVGEQVANGGVLAVDLPLRAVRAGETVRIGATVRRESAEPVFLLELDGRRVAEAVAAGPVGGVGEVEFAVTAPGPGLHRGRVLKDSDRLPVDDSYPFVLNVWDRVSVLLVHGADRGPVGRGGWRYLAEALEPGGAGQGLFTWRESPSSQLVAGDLTGVDVAVFVDPDPLGRQLLGGLLGWLADGGAALFLVGDPTLASYLEQTLLPAVGLPATLEFRSRPEAGAETTVLLAREHPVFVGLGSESLATLADITWRRYFALAEGERQVLLAFTSEAPALLEGRYGQGLFLWLPFNLALTGTELALSPMFLPLAQRLVAYLAQRGDPGGRIEVGQKPEVRVRGSRAARGRFADVSRLEVETPDDLVGTKNAELTWRHGVPVLVGSPSRRKGFFTFTAGGDTVGIVAAVPPAAEGDPQLGEVAGLQTILAAAGLTETADLGSVAPADFAAVLQGKEIARWLLAAALVLLCLESFLARGVRRT